MLSIQPATEETCTTYNILKVARHLFKWTGSAHLADFYERALLNGILGVQRPGNPGVSLYMLPLGPGNSKPGAAHGWGTPFDSFWCCYGTAVESFSKLTDSIFFVSTNTLYVNLYVNSILHFNVTTAMYVELKSNFPAPEWMESTTPPAAPEATLQLVSPTGLMIRFNASIMLRVPMWASVVAIKINGQPYTGPVAPGMYANLTQTWTVGTTISMTFTPKLHIERILDDRPMYRNLTAIFYGPLLLVGMTTQDRSLVLDQDHSDVSKWVQPAPYGEQLHSFHIAFTGNFMHHSGFMLWFSPMPSDPSQGTMGPDSTFRVITPPDKPSLIMLQSFNYPGFYICSKGVGRQLALVQDDGSTSFQKNCLFELVTQNQGLLFMQGDAYISSYKTEKDMLTMQMVPATPSEHDAWISSSAFNMTVPNACYRMFSFIATGHNRQYLLEPLNAVVDEEYTAYFNITTTAVMEEY